MDWIIVDESGLDESGLQWMRGDESAWEVHGRRMRAHEGV